MPIVKKQPRRRDEYWIQVSFFEMIARHQTEHPELLYTFHPPNEGWRPGKLGGEFKAMGSRKGVPDVMNPLWSHDKKYKGIVIEFKSSTGKLTGEQASWLSVLDSDGWNTLVLTDWVLGVKAMYDHFGFEYPRDLQASLKYPRGPR